MLTARLIIYISAFLVPLFVYNGAFNPFEMPKNVIIEGAAILLFAHFMFFDNWKAKLKQAITFDWLVLALIFLNFANFYYTQNPYYTRIASMLNISCLLIAYFVSWYVKDLKVLLIVIVCAGVIEAAIVLCQANGYFPVVEFGKGFVPSNLPGTVGNSNYAAAYMILPFFAGIAFYFRKDQSLRYLLPVAIIFLGVVALRGRSAWVGFFVGLMFFIWMLMKYRVTTIWELSRVLVLIAVCISVAVISVPSRERDKLTPDSILDASSLSCRVKYWRASWELIKEYPLLGSGLWSYRNLVYEGQAKILEKDPSYFTNYDRKPRRAHNDYLEALNDGGVVAGAMLLCFIITIYRYGMIVVMASELRFVMVALLSGLTAYLGSAVFFFPFRLNTTMFSVSVLIGMIVGMYRNENSD